MKASFITKLLLTLMLFGIVGCIAGMALGIESMTLTCITLTLVLLLIGALMLIWS